MQRAANLNEYRTATETKAGQSWLKTLSSIIETRQNDEQAIQDIIGLIVETTTIDNVSIAVPDMPTRFQAQYCSRPVVNGVYSFAVQHALCKAFESGAVLLLREGADRPDSYNKEALNSQCFSDHDHCLLLPLKIRQTTLAVLVVDLRSYKGGSFPIDVLWLLSSQLSHVMATQIVPNFKTLYSRPYQRVQEDELGQIEEAVVKCGGNKTMAAKVLGLTPRQLRYRLSKLTADTPSDTESSVAATNE